MQPNVFNLGAAKDSDPTTVPIILQWTDDNLVVQFDLTANQNQGAISRLRSISVRFGVGELLFSFSSGQNVVLSQPPKSSHVNVLQPNPIRFGVRWNTAGGGVAGLQTTINLNSFFIEGNTTKG